MKCRFMVLIVREMREFQLWHINSKKKLRESDAIVISFAEHNGAYSVAFKNVMDWISRIEKDTWANKPMLLLATSPGARGGNSVLEIATKKFRFMNSNKIEAFSLPSFHQNFDDLKGITNNELLCDLEDRINLIDNAIYPQNHNA